MDDQFSQGVSQDLAYLSGRLYMTNPLATSRVIQELDNSQTQNLPDSFFTHQNHDFPESTQQLSQEQSK